MKPHWLIGPLFGAALALRLGFGLHLPNELLLPDAASFDTIAWSVASTGHYAEYGHPTAYRPPSYVLFMAAIYKAAGHHYKAVRVAQAMVGTVLVLILMKTAQELGWDQRLLWIVGGMAAFYPFFIYYDGQLIADSFLTFWHATALWLTVRWIHKPEIWARGALVGLAFAIVVLIKSIFLPLAVLVFVVEAWKEKNTKSLGAMAVFLAFPLLLWGYRNERAFGEFFFGGHGGRTMMETIVHHDWVKSGTFLENWAHDPINVRMQSQDETTQDKFYSAYTKQYIHDHPTLYLKQSAARFKDLWRFYPRQDVTFREGGRLLFAISLLTEPFLIIAGVIGLWKARARFRELYPFYATLAFTTLAYTLITGQMRYRLPLMPIMILFASYAAFAQNDHASHH